MAGKSNRNKDKERQSNSVSNASELNSKSPDSAVSLCEETAVVCPTNGSVEEVTDSSSGIINEGVEKKGDDGNKNVEDASPEKSEGEVRLYPVSVKSMSGEKQELQLSPGDSVMDIRQFLLDAPETCFFTCYDLILHAKDGSVHRLEDYNEISEVVDISLGGCSIEMVPASYDDRSIRSHVHRTRELLSLSNLHASLSTSLAMQHESSQQKNPDAKEEIQEPDGMGFMEDITDSLCNLVAPQSKDIRCLECVTFSSLNPPPSYRRLVGDLIYLDAVTLEGNKYCITGMNKGFYVNSSTGLTLDPKHLKSSYEATTLVELLQKVSSKFKKGFREILDRKASAHPFENVQSILRPNLWLGVYPVPDHKRDEARAEDAFTLSYGSELIGMQRDWNEELQSCRDFPHTNVQERMMRDRALYKVTSDFVDAAINGAIGVVNRCIPPINPVDPEGFHMYVHNNIFFSFAIDADLGLVSKIPTNSNSKTVGQQEKTPSKDSGETDTSDNKVTELEAQLADSEQATYASANNDLKGTKAFQEADVAGLYNLAMAIIDYRGHRVVAQSIIPGILQGDKTDSLLYGSVDNGKKICWNESFHSKVLDAAKHLHLKEHTVLDASGNAVKLAAPVECKGIIGSDDRHYLLDLMRVTPRDANYDGPGSRFCVLRPELINLYCQAEATKASDCQAEATKASDTTNIKEFTSKPGFQNNSIESHCASSDTIVGVEIGQSTDVHNKVANDSCISKGDKSSISSSDTLLNPNVFTEFKLGDSEEEIAADESSVRKASSYLIDVAIPKYVEDLCNLDVSPMDGQTLTDTLHSHGINIRYLGKVANMVKHLPHLWNLFSMEIIVRSAKHMLKNTLRDAQDHEVGPAISHFLSCFIGNILPNAAANKVQKKDHTNVQSSYKSSKGQTRRSNATALKAALSTYLSLTSEGLWSTIQEFAKFKYQFELPEDARAQVKKVAVLRNLCQKVGISIASRKYDFDSASPFQISDILNVLPVVKHSIPVCSLARDIFEAGKFQLSEGKLNEAYTHFSEAFSILQQVTGPMHKDVANCCRYLAMVLYHAGDLAGAITQQHKELIINERCLGLDHPDTAHSYGNMALFYHGLSQTELALHHMSRTLLLLSLSSGPDHPDVAATFINIAMMYQDLGKMNTALRYLQEALKKNERLLGADHIQTAVCFHALAIAFNSIGAYKLSHQHEKSTYDILAKQLGKEDPRTQDSENWIKIFKMREAQANAQKQKGQVADSASAQKAIDILKAHPDLIKALQATNMGSGNLSSSSVNKPLNSPIKADAARTATSARKTAAARGPPARPNTNPVQKIPLNKNSTSTDSNSNLPASNGSSNDQAPVGLGSGLASPDSKKQKQKQLKKSM